MLEEARRETRGADPIFRAVSGRRRPLSPGVWRLLLRRLKIDATVHGFRSSFRDGCGETGVPREVAEACLAHTIRNQAEAAYARSDLLERRREVMEAWAGYCVERPLDAWSTDGPTSGTAVAALGGPVPPLGLPAGIISDGSNPLPTALEMGPEKGEPVEPHQAAR